MTTDPTEVELPTTWLAVQYRITETEYGAFYAEFRHFEEVHHAFERYLLHGENRLLAITRLSGEVMHIPASSLLAISEQSYERLSRDFAINATMTAREREVKRQTLGHDYDPERD